MTNINPQKQIKNIKKQPKKIIEKYIENTAMDE